MRIQQVAVNDRGAVNMGLDALVGGLDVLDGDQLESARAGGKIAHIVEFIEKGTISTCLRFFSAMTIAKST